MKWISIIAFVCFISSTGLCQFRKFETTIVAGLDAATLSKSFNAYKDHVVRRDEMIGIDLKRKISKKRWTSSNLSVFVTPQIVFTKYENTSQFKAQHIFCPLGLRWSWRPRVLRGENKGIEFYVNLGARLRYTLSAHLKETMYSNSSGEPIFEINGNPIQGHDRFSVYSAIGAGIRLGRISIYTAWYYADVSKELKHKPSILSEGVSSPFYQKYRTTPFADLITCIGYTF